jgi:ATP-binding cassette, subfamily F, member 3
LSSLNSSITLRFKLNRDLGGYATTMRAEVTLDAGDPPVHLVFPNPPDLRFPGSLISASSISFKYPKRTSNLLTDCTITIHPGDRVGLLGLNGFGKSTLVKLLIGSLKPTKGEVERHPRLRMGYYAQHSVEELSDAKAASQTAVQYFLAKLREGGDNDVDEPTARACLGTFGLQGKKAMIPIHLLSGGQKVNIYFLVPCAFLL